MDTEANDNFVTLNVGGHIYTTTRATLLRYPDSMLGRMFASDLNSAKDHNGHVIIDRDGTLFRYVLNFLRSDRLVLPADFTELDMLELEADFYQLTELTDAVKVLQKGKQYAKNNKEYLEIIYTSKHQLTIYANANVLNELTELARIFSKQQQTSWKQEIDKAPYRGFKLNMLNISGYQYPDTKDRSLNRIQLFKEISQLGFDLVGSSKTDSIESWTFSKTLPST